MVTVEKIASQFGGFRYQVTFQGRVVLLTADASRHSKEKVSETVFAWLDEGDKE